MKKKKIAGVIVLIIGGMYLIVGIVDMTTGKYGGYGLYSMIPSVVISLIGAFLLWKSRKLSEQVQEKQREKRQKKQRRLEEKQQRLDEKRRKKEEQEQIALKTLRCKHCVGLPLSERSVIALFFGDSALQISGDGNQFSLAYAKIYAMEVRTGIEIQRDYVSSAGGAIGGAALFGPIGGMIGGRVQEKRTTMVEHYLIISYDKDGNTQYMSFSEVGKKQARRNIDQVRSQFAATRHTVL